jgi:hypothetical protein
MVTKETREREFQKPTTSNFSVSQDRLTLQKGGEDSLEGSEEQVVAGWGVKKIHTTQKRKR